MEFLDSYFEDEVREGFYVPSLMKRAWAAQMELLEVVQNICDKHQIPLCGMGNFAWRCAP